MKIILKIKEMSTTILARISTLHQTIKQDGHPQFSHQTSRYSCLSAADAVPVQTHRYPSSFIR